MPALDAADLAQIRSRPVGRRFKLYVHQPESVWTGVVAGAPSRGDRTLVVTTATGNAGLIREDSTVRVTTAVGNPKSSPSKVRFRSYAAGPTEMTIADNDIDWAVGDLLNAQILFELWPRFVYADVTDPLNPVWYKDRDIAYVDEDTAFAPKSNPGPAAIGMISGGSCDLVFNGQHSYISPTGGAVIGYNWAAMGGGPAVVAGNPLTVTVTFRYTTPGFYYVRLTVTDANAMTDVCYVPVIVDDGTLAVDYTYPGDRGWEGSGWALSRVLPGIDSNESLFYDGAPVFLVADDRQVATIPFIPNRNNLRFSGWLIEDDVERDRYGRTGRYRAVSSAHIMRGLPAYPTGLRIDAGPTEWDYATTWNIDAILTYIFRWHSTVSRVCNVYVTGEWATRYAGEKDLISNSLLEQADWLLGGIVGNVRCSRQGGLRPMRHEWFLSAAEEAGRNTVMTLTNVDWQSARYGIRSHKATVREFNAGGLTGANTPFLAGSPGQAPLEGGRPDEKMDLLCNDQAELTRWAGQFLSFRNFDIPLVLEMSGEYDVVDPSYGEYVTATLSNYDPKLPDGPYAITGIRFKDDHKNGHTLSEWTLLPDPTAFGGYGSEDRDIPEIPPPPPPPPINGPPPPPPFDPPPGWPDVCIYPTRLGGVWYTITFTGTDSVVDPTWIALATSGVWPGDDLLNDFACDTDDPFSNMYAITTTAKDVIKFNGTTWVDILPASVYQNPGDPLYAGHVNCVAYSMWVDQANDTLWVNVGGGVTFDQYLTVYKSVNGGSGWTKYIVYNSGVYYYGHGNIMAYNDRVAVGLCSGAGGGSWAGWFSLNAGGAWTQLGDIGGSAYTQRLFIPMQTTHYVRRGFFVGFNIWRDDWDATPVLVDANPSPWGATDLDSPHKMWGDLTDTGHFRLVNANNLYTTADTWSTNINRGQLQIPGYNHGSTPVDVAGMAYRVIEEYDTDLIVYFSNDPNTNFPHCIFVADGETDVTPEVKSGTDPETPDGSSIPRTAGGCCHLGAPWLFFSDDITLP